jgi:hypothetical protein
MIFYYFSSVLSKIIGKEGGMVMKHNTGTFKKRHFKYLKT